ncbi:hypothetical protein QM996_31545 (plasmid) [Sinorhizobium chiapasense]
MKLALRAAASKQMRVVKEWLYAILACQLAKTGSYVTMRVGEQYFN